MSPVLKVLAIAGSGVAAAVAVNFHGGLLCYWLSRRIIEPMVDRLLNWDEWREQW